MGQQTGFYPIFLDLGQRKCVVVGGGPVAERKAVGLLKAGAEVTIVSPDVTQGLQRLVESGDVRLLERAFEETDLEGATLAFAATDSQGVNQAVSDAASRSSIPVNIADRSNRGDFIVPSSFRKGPLQVAISTGGGSPALARIIRQDLEHAVADELVELAQMLERLRPRVQSRFPENEPQRRRVWARLVAPDVLEHIQAKSWDRVEEIVAECLS